MYIITVVNGNRGFAYYGMRSIVKRIEFVSDTIS
jgi:hypothetical protein